jgi:L-cysteine S-thiosulfotransferase
MAVLALLPLTGAGCTYAGDADPSSVPSTYRVVGDAIPQRLSSAASDAARGRMLALARETSCILCHAFPEPGQRFAGDIGPPLAGVGARLSIAQLRLRIVDQARLNPQTPMPAYLRSAGLERVASAYRGKSILTPEEIEDVVAYLATLR